VNTPTPRLLSPSEQLAWASGGGEARSELSPVEMELKKLVNERMTASANRFYFLLFFNKWLLLFFLNGYW
jgi:hypothetical protein